MDFDAQLPLMDFGGNPYTLRHLVDYTERAAGLGFRAPPPPCRSRCSESGRAGQGASRARPAQRWKAHRPPWAPVRHSRATTPWASTSANDGPAPTSRSRPSGPCCDRTHHPSSVGFDRRDQPPGPPTSPGRAAALGEKLALRYRPARAEADRVIDERVGGRSIVPRSFCDSAYPSAPPRRSPKGSLSSRTPASNAFSFGRSPTRPTNSSRSG
jgi:hypothetical protein